MDISTPEEEDFPGRLLHQAALWDNAELLEDLLRGDQLAHINSQDSWGRTPLHAASTTENSRCLRVLLQAGADPNIPCGPRGDNKTPLHTCSEHGFVGNVMLLLAHNGDLVSRDSCGMTALDIAEKGEHAECMQVLKQAADARELARQSSYLALREAVASGDVATVRNIIFDLGPEAELLINMAPSGSNTLLFICRWPNPSYYQVFAFVHSLLQGTKRCRRYSAQAISRVSATTHSGMLVTNSCSLHKRPSTHHGATAKIPLSAALVVYLCAYPDPEHRINKKAMNEKIPSSSSQFGALQNLTYSNMFANTPVMINWHCQRCQLTQIRPQWLVDAALHVNPKLKLNPRSQDVVLYAITRLDISNNALAWLPPMLFQLHSLRYLNVAQNKIEKLPTNEDFMDVDTRNKRHSKSLKFVKGYSAPMLEELYLQDNRLEWLPEELFNLPALVTLDVCNNKLPALPFKMWRAQKLKELNDISDTGSVCSVDSTKSGDSEMLLNSPMKSSSSCLNSPEILSNNRTVQLLSHHNVWSRSVEVTEQILHPEHDASEDCSQLSSLNLAHNQFTSVPVVLSCLAVNLTRLNLSYN
ncbi:hypothetical protein LSTR_LSTR009743, partial [Laodelphax striatellus]